MTPLQIVKKLNKMLVKRYSRDFIDNVSFTYITNGYTEVIKFNGDEIWNNINCPMPTMLSIIEETNDRMVDYNLVGEFLTTVELGDEDEQ